MLRKLGIMLILGIFSGSFSMQYASGNEFVASIQKDAKAQILPLLQNKALSIRFPFEGISGRYSGKSEQTLSSSSKIALERLDEFLIISAEEDIDILSLRIDGLTIHGPIRTFTLDEQAPNDSLWSKQWALQDLKITQAWNIAKGDNVVVSVIDTGCDIDHPDLKKNIFIRAEEDLNQNNRFDAWPSSEIRDGIAGDINGIDEDGNGWADDITGYDFVNQSFTNIGDDRFPDPIVIDEQGHGTSVAGIIGAQANNSIGMAGIAPNCKLMTVRAFDATGNAEEDDVALAIVYSALAGARVICMSFGDAVYSPMTKAAIDVAHSLNCVLIASAGNDGKTGKRYPAGYEHVIAVGATNQFNSRAPFSSYGSRLGMVAPGTGIMTTARRGGYRSFQGTSASAPIVAGTAALLLSVNPALSNDDITGMLLSSAKDLGEIGWDFEYGAGIINPVNALNKKGRYEASITSPKRDAIINVKNQKELAIIGSTMIPLFSSWSLEIGIGDVPNAWTPIQQFKQDRILNDTLGVLRISDSYLHKNLVLRLTIFQNDQSTIEYRSEIMLISPDSSLRLISSRIDSVWRDDRMVSMISTEFSHPCRASIRIVHENDTLFLSDDDKVSFKHHYLLPYLHGDAFSAKIHAGFLHASDTLLATLQGNAPSETGNPFSAGRKPYAMPMTYLYEKSIKDNFGNAAIIGTDYTTGNFGNTRIFSFTGNTFQITDSIAESWIVKGVADVNGDAESEVLAHSLGEMRLFGKAFKGNALSAFGKVLLKETLIPGIKEFWSAGLADITGDGISEIFGFSDTNCVVLTYADTAFKILGIMPNTSRRGPSGSPNSMRPPAISITNIDGDTNPDIIFGDTDGDVIYYEYENANFTLRHIIESDESGATEFTRAGDLDGDGISEVIVGRYRTPELNEQREYDAPLWSLTVHKVAQDTLQAIHREILFGARVGLEYRNGISMGNLDEKPGEEIILCAFPNAYVFGFENNRLINRFHYPQCFSNSAVIGDIDGNGRNEFGFGDGNANRFFEMQSNDGSDIPRGLTAISLGANKARLTWSGNADSYEILAVENPTFVNDTIRSLAFTDSNSIEISSLNNRTLYEFYVIGIKDGNRSDLSIPAYAFTHDRFAPGRMPKDLTVLNNGNALKIRYTGPLSSIYPAPKAFHFSGNEPIIHTAIPAGDSSIILTFSEALKPNTMYKLHCGEISDAYDSPTLADSISFMTDSSLSIQKTFIISSLRTTPFSLMITYSEPVNMKQAMDMNSYVLEPVGDIAWIDSIDQRTVNLMIDPNKPLRSIGREYYIGAKGITSILGEQLHPIGSTATFIISPYWEDLFCYPQPWKTQESSMLTFAGVPNNTTLVIRRVSGEIIATLKENNGAGGIMWDGILSDGTSIQSGVYLYSIDIEGKQQMHKFTVIRK
ncbi:MAG: S8 family serine peptidase [bacterium]